MNASFLVQLVPIDALTSSFLNPSFYAPEYLALDKSLRQRSDATTLRHATGRLGPSKSPTIYQGKSPKGGSSPKGRINLVMPRTLTGFGLSPSNDFVPTGSEKQFSSRLLSGGEILLLRSAHKADYVGDSIDVFLGSEIPTAPSDTVIAIRVKDTNHDPCFVVSFLRSKRFGYPQIQRRITSQNAKLTPDALTGIVIVSPDDSVQSSIRLAIGHKVLRARQIDCENRQFDAKATINCLAVHLACRIGRNPPSSLA